MVEARRLWSDGIRASAAVGGGNSCSPGRDLAQGMRERGVSPEGSDSPPPSPPSVREQEVELADGGGWAYSVDKPGLRTRPPRDLLDPCVASNVCILAVSLFLVYCRNFELAMMAFLLFCASMLYHRSRESEWMWLDVALGRTCALYYVAATCTNATWEGTDLYLKLSGYFAFAVIAYLTNGPASLDNWTEQYDRLHPLVHILGVIPPAVGGLICKPYIF